MHPFKNNRSIFKQINFPDPLVEILDQKGRNLEQKPGARYIFGLQAVHGYESQRFVEANPDLAKTLGLKPEELQQRLDVDFDFGTFELSEAIAERIAEKVRQRIKETLGIDVEFIIPVIKTNLPRALVDMNRHQEIAIPDWAMTRVMTFYKVLLRKAYFEAEKAHQKILPHINQGIQVHSMSPETPQELSSFTKLIVKVLKEILKSDDIKKLAILEQAITRWLTKTYVKTWTSANGTARKTNILSYRDVNPDLVEQGIDVTNTELSDFIVEAFKRIDKEVVIDGAYQLALGSGIKSVDLTRNMPHRWSILDIVKQQLAKGDAKEVIRNLHDLTIDPDKVDELAEALSDAAVEAIFAKHTPEQMLELFEHSTIN